MTDRRRELLIALGIAVAFGGAIATYQLTRETATFGQPCDESIACTGERATCYYDAPNHGVCTQTCTSRDDTCDHAGGCALVDEIDGDRPTGAKIFVCVGAP